MRDFWRLLVSALALFLALFLLAGPASAQTLTPEQQRDLAIMLGIDPDGMTAEEITRRRAELDAEREVIARRGWNAVTQVCLESPAALEGFECLGQRRQWNRFQASWRVYSPFFFSAMNRSFLGTAPTDSAPGTACLSCDFIGQVTHALFVFFAAAYQYFWSAFVFFAPVLIAIWLVVKAIGLFLNGGQNGQAFARGLSHKILLFGFVWLLMVTPGSTPGTAWAFEASGPGFVDYSFEVSSALRQHLFEGLDVSIPNLPDNNGDFRVLGCDVSGQMPHLLERPHGETVVKVVDLACSVERFHGVGIGLAGWMVQDGFTQIGWFLDPFTLKGPRARIIDVGNGVISVAAGLLLFIVFVRSAMWTIFQVVDVVLRITFTAAILPLCALAGLFEKTRPIAKRGAMSFLGAFVQTLALSLVLPLWFFLLTLTPAIYEATRADYVWAAGLDEPLLPLVATSVPGQFSEMMYRANIDKDSWSSEDLSTHIPFHVSTPWFLFLLFVALSVAPLGRKIMSITADLFQVTEQVGTGIADAVGAASNKAISAPVAVVGAGVSLATSVAGGGRSAAAKNPFARRGVSLNPKKGK